MANDRTGTGNNDPRQPRRANQAESPSWQAAGLCLVAVMGLAACGETPDDPWTPGPGMSTTGNDVAAPDPDAGVGGSTTGMVPGGGTTAGMMPGSGTTAGMMPGSGTTTGGVMDPDGGVPAADGAMPEDDGGMPEDDAGGGATPTDDAYTAYHDPGTGPWEMGTNEDCNMDTSLIQGRDNLAVFRYGKLCHIQGGNTNGTNWSATKTLGGVLAGRAAFLVKDVPRTGPGTGPILHEDKMTDWVGNQSGLNSEALLSHIMSMTAFNSNLAWGSKRFQYDTLGTREITVIVDVAMEAVGQLGGSVTTSSREFMQTEVFDKLGMEGSRWAGGTIGYGWSGTLEDMGRMGVMLAHDGWYGGERYMEASWVYRMSHPTHEDSNTTYGQLAWLNARGNGTGFGASQVDDCAPAAIWPSYPHIGSEATDCNPGAGYDCEMEEDVGVFSAQGLGGQFVVVHPGLDLVITSHNSGDPSELWADVRPAVVAMDPNFMGDESAFCEAYGSNKYAPDLLVPRIAPTE